MKTSLFRPLVATIALALAGAAYAATAQDLPPNWHVHDGQTQLGPAHKPVGFFPAILGQSSSDYRLDPAICPNATDKALLPSNGSDNQPDRAGVCMTTTTVIHLRSIPVGDPAPEGWSLQGTSGGIATYYRLTAR